MTLGIASGGDMIKEFTTTTGAGAIHVPNVAAAGFATFDSWYSDGDRVTYGINDANGNWEVGIGTYTAATHQISRDNIWWSSNAGAIVDFTGLVAAVYSTQNSGGGNMAVQYHRSGTTGVPIATDDRGEMVDVGSFWIQSVAGGGEVFFCLDASAAAAVWIRLLSSNAKIRQDFTDTAGGTTGAQVIDKPKGSVNFAAAASSLVVTNSLVTADSHVYAVVKTADATAWIKNVVPGAGAFTINLGAAATAETRVAFWVTN